MPKIRCVHSKNFRALREFVWHPSPGFNCIIGPGDIGKSTILDIIDIALGARKSYSFNDADFFQSNTGDPIEIWLTLGDLPDELKNIDTYGRFLRGYNVETHEIHDEPKDGDETVITIKVKVTGDLDADWRLYSARAEADGYERRLIWSHRELISAARLGTTSQHHLAWGNRSVLNKFSEQTLDVSSTFTQISRAAREAFADQQPAEVADVLGSVKQIADTLGVTLGDLKAQLDVKGITLSAGAIALHDEDNTPLRQLGTGSARLLIAGLHKAASKAGILLVDEAEYGLEPFRITRLLNELGSKDDEPEKQVFITTHSPFVLRELKADQLQVVRPTGGAEGVSHHILRLGASDDEQSTLRACAEAFLGKRVIVCEGKTEIGFVRGIDLYDQSAGGLSIFALGVVCADGSGDNLFKRAAVFSSLGYPVAIFKDSDKASEHAAATQEAAEAGIGVYEWGDGRAIEDAIIQSCPEADVPALLGIACNRKSRESVDAVIKNKSGDEFGLDDCEALFDDSMRAVLSKCARDKSWFKDIEPAERVAKDVIAPSWDTLPADFTAVVNQVFDFAKDRG